MSVSQDSSSILVIPDRNCQRTQVGAGNFAQVETSWEGVVVISSGLSHESSKDQHSG
jgi:hypothetical protein